jgi:hypothetical protein
MPHGPLSFTKSLGQNGKNGNQEVDSITTIWYSEQRMTAGLRPRSETGRL